MKNTVILTDAALRSITLGTGHRMERQAEQVLLQWQCQQ